MPGISFVIDDAEINTAIDRVARAGGDTSPLMQAIAPAMLFGVQRRFESESAPDGSKWQPLSPRTAARRIGNRRRGTKTMLRVRGRLYSSIVAQASSKEAAVGTNLSYARIHQLGGTINVPERSTTIRLRKVKGRTRFAAKRHKRVREMDVTIGAHTITIPARPWLGFSDEDRNEILKLTEEHFQRAVGGITV